MILYRWKTPQITNARNPSRLPVRPVCGFLMDAPIEDIATAFSRHRFEDAYPYLADDVRWNQVGREQVKGKDAVRAACDATANALAGVETIFHRFDVRVTDTFVVIESVTTYREEEG